MGAPTDIVALATGLGVALGIGLLIGLERERSKRAKHPGGATGQAGVRTFALLALGGALAALLGNAAVYVAGFFVACLGVASYRATARSDPSLTTEVAMLVTLLLGMLALSSPAVAGGAGVVVATVLANRRRLHRLSRQWLSERELHDLLTLAAAAFVVMPLLPDHAIDPWGALNPRRVWMLVVAVMAIGSLGYLSLRAFGLRFGLPIAGLAGGFASSTATVAAMGERARSAPALVGASASAALLSNVGTVVQLAVVTGALSPALLSYLAIPLVASGSVAVVVAIGMGWRAFSVSDDRVTIGTGRPFEVMTALRFGALLAGIMLLAAILRARWGPESLPWVMAISGVADVHAAAASVAQAVTTGGVDMATAAIGVFAALVTNSCLKCAAALVKGGRSYALRVIPGIAAIVIAFALALGWA
ncbi:MgtC/SapB family protein [Luteibacter flocculans]|uniref:MgtC/SapB family protein n=1 Tax=Luteibacter flocculans TaxID=2780091 RepID=A0ABY4T5C7_9GAMM|nr:DUF4010 domain-containing protein [Luteibacter flocculans]URL60108.1 MgtC/SapB family protein [Luteibacter flocculans]